jgi:hypothetical protein
MVSSHHNINLLKPEQRVRERIKNAENDPRVYKKMCGIFISQCHCEHEVRSNLFFLDCFVAFGSSQ